MSGEYYRSKLIPVCSEFLYELHINLNMVYHEDLYGNMDLLHARTEGLYTIQRLKMFHNHDVSTFYYRVI